MFGTVNKCITSNCIYVLPKQWGKVYEVYMKYVKYTIPFQLFIFFIIISD